MNIDPREDADLPLSPARIALLLAGATLFLAQMAAAWFIAPAVTGPGDANGGALFGLWVACIGMSIVAALCLIRQAEIPDVATAAMLVTIPACGAFSLSAAYDLRGTEHSTNLSDALMLGVTGGALTAMIVWGASMAVARTLRLPRARAD